MAELKNRSIRVDDDVWAAIQALPGRTQNEALRAALFGRDADDSKIDEILELVRSIGGGGCAGHFNHEQHDTPQTHSARILPSAEPFEPLQDNRPKNAYCKHCGNRFAGARFATICPECKSSGHTNQPAECPACTEGRAI